VICGARVWGQASLGVPWEPGWSAWIVPISPPGAHTQRPLRPSIINFSSDRHQPIETNVEPVASVLELTGYDRAAPRTWTAQCLAGQLEPLIRRQRPPGQSLTSHALPLLQAWERVKAPPPTGLDHHNRGFTSRPVHPPLGQHPYRNVLPCLPREPRGKTPSQGG
jgi:hypothetical protein